MSTYRWSRGKSPAVSSELARDDAVRDELWQRSAAMVSGEDH
jgi:hypothetical protein